MARFDGPVRFQFDGDPELARQYISYGRNLLGEVRERMQRGGIAELSRLIRLNDGTFVKVRSGYGENTIQIYAQEPEQAALRRRGEGFVTVPASDEAPNGWGQPFFDGNQNPINPPLGMPGGGNPETLLTWFSDGWRPRRFWQYSDIWPDGLKYGNNSWAGRTVNFNDIALSWDSEQRYRHYGFLFTSKVIYYNGYVLCNTKEYVIGAAVIGQNLVAQSATFHGVGRVAKWHFRTFRSGGYQNDDDYDAETNPYGWRECEGDFQEEFAREDARQPTVFTPDGLKAAGSYVVFRANYGVDKDFVFDINVVTYNFSSVGDRVTVTRTRELNTYNSTFGPYVSSFSHRTPENEDGKYHVDHSETPNANFYAPIFNEYDPEGNLIECGMTGGYGTFDYTNFFPPGSNVNNLTERYNISTFQFGKDNIQGSFVNSRTEQFDDQVVGGFFINNQVAVLDGNLSLGYYMLLLRNEQSNTFFTRVVLVGPGIGNVELFASPNWFDYPYFAPRISVFFPAHSDFEEEFDQDTIFYIGLQSQRLGRAIGIADSEFVQPGFEHYFAAHRNADGQIIVTAWARWDRGSEVLFGAYDFITNGNLPSLTQVQGTNPRHKNTGVI